MVVKYEVCYNKIKIMIDYISWFQNLPPELATALIAASPLIELRGAIPVALGVYKMTVAQAIFWAVLGNIIPTIFILWLLGPISQFLMKYSETLNAFLTRLFEKTRQRHNHKFEYWGSLALIIVVAIPLPFTGAWTGSLAAFVFGVKYWRALLLIFIGVSTAAVLVTLASLGIFKIF